MSWSSWSSKLNVQSIVSQGLEQVSKLKEDVEKQFDQVIASSSSAQAPGSRSRTTPTQEAVAAAAAVVGPTVNESLLKEIADIPPPLPPPPPRSMDGKSNSAALPTSLGIVKAASINGDIAGTIAGDERSASASAPTSTTTKQSAADFFGSYVPNSNTKNETDADESTATPLSKEWTRTMAASTDSPSAEPPPGTVETEQDPTEQDASTPTSTPTSEVIQEQVDTDPQASTAVIEDEEEEEEVADEIPPPVTETVDTVDASATGMDVDVTSSSNSTEPEPPTLAQDHEQDPTDSTTVHTVHTVHTVQQHEDASSHKQEILLLQQQLSQRETQLLSTSATIQELHDELDKTCQREVAAVERNRFLTDQLEMLRQEVLRLNRVVTQHQAASPTELQALQQAVAEKDARLQALLDEGQALSVKKSQLEQRLRQLRREKNEEEELKLKLQAQSDMLAIQVQELTFKHKESESERKKLATELKTLQQSADATAKQLQSTQEDAADARATIAALEQQLASTQSTSEALREELRTLRDTSASHATLSEEKREMEATIQFLQQSVRDLEADAQRREETARLESLDLKRKWQDALHRVEAMGQSVSEATQPLLRQIHALQEDQRARQETWRATEATLLQRLQDASAQRTRIESERLASEQQLHDLRVQFEDLQAERQRQHAEIARERERVDVAVLKEREARSKGDALQIERDELSLKLQDALHARHSAMLARSESASKQREDEDKSHVEQLESMAAQVQELRSREDKLRHDLEWHQKELQRVKAVTSSPRLPAMQGRRSFTEDDWAGSANSSPRTLLSQPHAQASILQRTLESSVDDSRLGSASVLGMSQLQQRLRLREGENRLLRQQLQAIEDKQKQTTDEIVRLSTRNALLESSATQFEATQHELAALKQKQHVLLELFGEKEEQVEELQAEVAELKVFYRKQLDTLARQQQ